MKVVLVCFGIACCCFGFGLVVACFLCLFWFMVLITGDFGWFVIGLLGLLALDLLFIGFLNGDLGSLVGFTLRIVRLLVLVTCLFARFAIWFVLIVWVVALITGTCAVLLWFPWLLFVLMALFWCS